MALATQFVRLLDDCMRRRTERLRRMAVGGLGAPKQFSTRIRDKLKKDLLRLASQVLVREYAKKEFSRIIVRRHRRIIRGFGYQNRFDRLARWAERRFDGPIVYAFWRGDRCLYVGKGKNTYRLGAYQKSIYLTAADGLRVWQINTKTQLPRAECLAIHLFSPRDNKQRAAEVKWGKKCPVCKIHDEMRRALDDLFRLR